jgi:hypothetical protein
MRVTTAMSSFLVAFCAAAVLAVAGCGESKPPQELSFERLDDATEDTSGLSRGAPLVAKLEPYRVDQGAVRVRGSADLPDSTRLEITLYRRGTRDPVARCHVSVLDRGFDSPPLRGSEGALPSGEYTIEVLAHFSDTMQPPSVLATTDGGRRLRGPGMTRGRFGIPAFQIVEDHRL